MAMKVTLLPTEVRAAGTVDSQKVTVWEKFEAAHIVIDHPNVGGGLTVSLLGYDSGAQYSYSLGLSGALVASGHTLWKIGPQYTAAAGVAKEYVPYQFYVSVTASGTNAYGVYASVI